MPVKRSDFTIEKAVRIASNAGIASEFFTTLPIFNRDMASSTYDLARIAVLNSIFRAVEKEGFDTFKANLDKDALKGIVKSASRTSYRTALLNTYNVGTAREAIESDSPRYLMYDAINDSRTRPGHAALDGVVKRATSDFWNTHTPPLGFNCRCVLRSLTKSRAQKVAEDDGRKTISTTNKKITQNIRDFKEDNPNFRGKKITAGSDKGFSPTNPKDPLGQIDKFLKNQIDDLPQGTRAPFRESLRRREAESRAWYEKNKDKFTNN